MVTLEWQVAKVDSISVFCYHHHHHHLPPWIRSFDLFRHRRVAIVSRGVHDLFSPEVCSWGRVSEVWCCPFFQGGWSGFVCIWLSRLVFQRSLQMYCTPVILHFVRHCWMNSQNHPYMHSNIYTTDVPNLLHVSASHGCHHQVGFYELTVTLCTVKRGKAIPLQVWTGPKVSRRLRPPDFLTIGTWWW